jgi:hypothetical protein
MHESNAAGLACDPTSQAAYLASAAWRERQTYSWPQATSGLGYSYHHSRPSCFAKFFWISP